MDTYYNGYRIDLGGAAPYYLSMEGPGHFNRLVSELSLEDRAALLEKLSNQSSISASVLYEESGNIQTVKSEPDFIKLPWYYKIWFFIVSFFNSRPPLKLYEEHIMAQHYRDLDETSPGFYHYQKDMLLPKFQEELIKLRDGSRFFYNALDASFNRDKGGLMVFLGSLELQEIHKKITAELDPAFLVSSNPNMEEMELRKKAVKTLEEILSGIGEEDKAKMYKNARSLFCLKQLASFLFDRLINSFIFDKSSQGYICPAASAQDQLILLNNILYSLKTPPPIALLQSLFVFVLMEKSDDPNFDIQNEMRRLLVQAEVSLQAIRDFNFEVPLTKLLRCISRDANYSAKTISGGEDWFVTFKDRWKHQVEENFLSFTRTRHQRDLQNAFRYFFKGTSLKTLEHIYSEQNPAGIKIRGSFCLSFLLTFYSVVLMGEASKFLRPILIDGEFIKKDNRTEFTESYNTLIKIEDRVKLFDQNLSSEGDFGKRYLQAKNDMSSLPVKRRKVQLVLEEAHNEADRIIDQTRDALDTMNKVLEGIIQKTDDGKYDTLGNLSVIAGRGTAFLDGVGETIQQFAKTLKLMDDIDKMEAGISASGY